jgi:hypothetical protein
MVCPGLVALFIWTCPESPRYLIAKSEIAQARKVTAALHANGDESHPLVDLEITEAQQALANEGTLTWKTYFDVKGLFRTRARRYRMMLNMTFAWFGQFSGNK